MFPPHPNSYLWAKKIIDVAARKSCDSRKLNICSCASEKEKMSQNALKLEKRGIISLFFYCLKYPKTRNFIYLCFQKKVWCGMIWTGRAKEGWVRPDPGTRRDLWTTHPRPLAPRWNFMWWPYGLLFPLINFLIFFNITWLLIYSVCIKSDLAQLYRPHIKNA